MLTLTLKSPLSLPIAVDSVLPETVSGFSIEQIGEQLIWCGKNQQPLRDFFDVTGSAAEDLTIQWRGCADDLGLARINRIGQNMTTGTMLVRGDAGLHTGWQMQGGRIEVQGSADDYLGSELAGGTILVSGNAGNHAGGRLCGEKTGMNRGQIFIQGSAGDGLGQGMRRGTIVVGQQAGKLVGWNMLAGTIICLQGCGPHPGAGMVRGSIVAAADSASAATIKQNNWLLPSFSQGATNTVPIFRTLKKWLATNTIDSRPVFSPEQLALLDQTYQVFHGDRLAGGRGEVFLAADQQSQ